MDLLSGASTTLTSLPFTIGLELLNQVILKTFPSIVASSITGPQSISTLISSSTAIGSPTTKVTNDLLITVERIHYTK